MSANKKKKRRRRKSSIKNNKKKKFERDLAHNIHKTKNIYKKNPARKSNMQEKIKNQAVTSSHVRYYA